LGWRVKAHWMTIIMPSRRVKAKGISTKMIRYYMNIFAQSISKVVKKSSSLYGLQVIYNPIMKSEK